MKPEKCHFRIYVRDENHHFTVPILKNGQVLVFHSLKEAIVYAQKEIGFKCDFKIK